MRKYNEGIQSDLLLKHVSVQGTLGPPFLFPKQTNQTSKYLFLTYVCTSGLFFLQGTFVLLEGLSKAPQQL
jgi:hypothetical protein